MGTRGALGFIVNGVSKFTYNQYDSYPEWLGVRILEWLHSLNESSWIDARMMATLLEPVTDETPATPDQIAYCTENGWYNPKVGVPSGHPTWYQLLRETQGDPAAILRAIRYEEAGDFVSDTLFCEYFYVIDFDRAEFVSYENAYESQQARVLARIPFSALPSKEDYLQMCGAAQDA